MDPATTGVLSRLRTLTRSKQPAAPTPAKDSPRRFKSIRDEALQLPSGISEFDQWRNQVGQLNPRAPGIVNEAAQFFKKVMRRLLSWYTRPLNHSDAALSAVLWRLAAIVEALSRTGMGTEEEIDRLKSEVKSGNSQSVNLNQMKFLLDQLEALSNAVSKLRVDLDSSIESRRDIQSCDALDSVSLREQALDYKFSASVQFTTHSNGHVVWRGTTERILEQGWVLRNLGDLSVDSSILCLASADDILPIELASAGHKVTGLDARPYSFRHPNFIPLQGSFLGMDIRSNSFDAVIALSMVEARGFIEDDRPSYEDEIELRLGKIHEVLKKGGLLLTAIPFGVSAAKSAPLVCSSNDEQQLFGNFVVHKRQFGLRLDDHTWITSVDRSLAAMWPVRGLTSTSTPAAIAMLVLRKQ